MCKSTLPLIHWRDLSLLHLSHEGQCPCQLPLEANICYIRSWRVSIHNDIFFCHTMCKVFDYVFCYFIFFGYNWRKELLRLKVWYSCSIRNFIMHNRKYFCSVRSCIIFQWLWVVSIKYYPKLTSVEFQKLSCL